MAVPLALAAASACAAASAAPGQLDLKLLPGAAVCLDGSPAGYYHSLNASSDLWVIFLKGGGACSNAADCGTRAKTDLGSSSGWKKQVSGKAVYSRDCTLNPDFCAANLVFINYCSGDGHRGQRNGTSAATFGFHFSGHNNFKAIVADLLTAGLSRAGQRALLTGCSAGGTGTLTNADTLSALVPAGVAVKASPLAGWFFPGDTGDQPAESSWTIPTPFSNWTAGEAASADGVEAEFARIGALYDAYWQPRCVEANADHPSRCHTAHVYAPYIETPLLISENMWDSYQLNNVMNVPHSAYKTADGLKYAAYYAQAMRNSTLNTARRSGNGLFMPACLDHCGHIQVGRKGTGKQAAIGGRYYVDVLGDWFFGRGSASSVVMDTCGDKPCNAACKNVDPSQVVACEDTDLA